MIPARWQSIAGTTLIVAALGGCASRDGTDPNVCHPIRSSAIPRRARRARIAGPERVTFDSLDRDPATGAPVRITGLLFRPQVAVDAPQSGGHRAARLWRHVQRASCAQGSVVAAASGDGGPLGGRGLSRAVSRQLPLALAGGDLHDRSPAANHQPDPSAARCAGRAGLSAGARRRGARSHRGARLVAWRQRRAGHREREEPRGGPVARSLPARHPIFAPAWRSIRDASTPCARERAMPRWRR